MTLDLSKWEKWAERPSTVQRNEFMAKQLWRDGQTDFLAIPRGKNVEYLMRSDQKTTYYSKLAVELQATNLEKHVAQYNLAAEALIEKSEIDLKQSNGQLAAAYREFCEANDNLAVFYQTPWVVEKYIDPILKQRLAIEFAEERAKRIYEAVTAPTELIAFQEMQIELRRVCTANYTECDVEELIEKFAWIAEYSLQEELYDAGYFKKQLELTRSSEGPSPLDAIEQNKQKFKEVLQLLSPDTAKLALLLNKYVTLRTQRVDVLKKALFNMRPFYKQVAKQLSKIGATYKDVINLTKNEIIALLENGTDPELSEVRKRTTTLAYLCKGGRTSFLPMAAIKEETTTHAGDNTNGLTANSGIASGPAVIVITRSDLLKVRTGCVMVCRTTFPEYTPFMRKAVAIVTDEGGITSHAAIVSRELNVPCIVGTKNATKIFADNETITVNGQKGTVEKLHN